MGSGCCVCSKKIPTSLPQEPDQSLFVQVSKDEALKRQQWLECLRSFEYFQDPLSHFYHQHPNRFKKLLIEGPPSDLRWEVWKVLFEYKSRTLPSNPIDCEFLTLIEKDLDRTFPTHPFFSVPETISNLRELLINIVRLNPELGYCQGMNSVAGVFLMVSSNNVLESTVMMDIFINKYKAKSLFEPGFPKVHELIEIFNKVFKARLHSLFNHFEQIELDQQLWIAKWFMTLFAYSFKLEAVQRFWDVIFAFGLNSMVNLALSVLQKMKHELEKMDLVAVLDFLNSLRAANFGFEDVVRTSCRAQSTIVSPVESLWKETDPDGIESKIRISLEAAEEADEGKSQPADIEGRKRANSLIIQHSPRHGS